MGKKANKSRKPKLPRPEYGAHTTWLMRLASAKDTRRYLESFHKGCRCPVATGFDAEDLAKACRDNYPSHSTHMKLKNTSKTIELKATPFEFSTVQDQDMALELLMVARVDPGEDQVDPWPFEERQLNGTWVHPLKKRLGKGECVCHTLKQSSQAPPSST